MRFRNILATALCVCVTASSCVPFYAGAVENSGTVGSMGSVYDIWLYEKTDDGIQINYCSTMAEGDVEIPAEIDGLPVTAIKSGAFASCKVTSVKIPDTVRTIGEKAFAVCKNLTSVNIPKGVEVIPDEAFLNCYNLKEIKLPSTVKTIGTRAFYECEKINSLNIPESVSEIGEMAFYGCKSVKVLEIPENVTAIQNQTLPMNMEMLIVRNPECTIDENVAFFISRNCLIIANDDSKAKQFAEQYGYQFQSLDLSASDFSSGDSNFDGKITVADAVTIQQYLIGNKLITPLQYDVMDLNGDGKVDAFDFVVLRKNLSESVSISAVNLTINIKSDSIEGNSIDDTFIDGQMKFALQLLQNTKEEKNIFVSPYSVMQALAMTANGADGQTKQEMENVLGGISIEELNKYLYTFRTSQPNDEKCKVKTANSVWYRDYDGLEVNQNFLQKTVDFYSAEEFKAPFNDVTVKDINNWVYWHTDNMIDSIIDKIESDTMLYLINAVVFDAKWASPYKSSDVGKRTFTAYDGTQQQTDMMYSDENIYIKDDNAKGIYKLYNGGKYAFTALMPDENISLDEYISSLTPEKLKNLVSNPEKAFIQAGIPKFKYDYDIELSDILSDMGMPTAFEKGSVPADLTKMAVCTDGNLYIGKVLHKTHIEVDEEGTKAAAVTAVEITECSAPIYEDTVILDRPFVYFIIDTETGLPIFTGTFVSVPQ